MICHRRELLIGLGAATGVLLTGRHAAAAVATLPRHVSQRACRPTPQAAEGPFYSDAGIERSNICEGRPGIPLELVLTVVAAGDCTALPGIRVDVWQTDAAGCYSGFQGQGDGRDLSTVGQTFLRGRQRTDDGGEVRFTTIYPGWYAGRTPHIHFKLFADDTPSGIGQIYFPDGLSEFIFATVAPYMARKRRRDTFNRDDRVLQSHPGRRDSVCTVAAAEGRLVASLTIALGNDAAPDAAPQIHRPAPRAGAPDAHHQAGERCRQSPLPAVDI